MVDTPNINLALPDEVDNIDDEIYRLRDNLILLDTIIGNLLTAVAGKAPTLHTHTLAQIDGLVAALAGKMPSDKTFALGDLTDVVGASGAPAGYIFSKNAEGKYQFISAAAAIGNHQHVVADIIDFDTNVTAQFAQIRGNVPAGLNTLEKIATSLGNDTALNTTLRGLITAANNAAANANTAATNANNNANSRLATSGGKMFGEISVEFANPYYKWHYPGVRVWYAQVIGNGHLRFVDESGNAERFRIEPNGAIGGANWFMGADGNINGSAYGNQYLTTYIYNTANERGSSQGQAWANDRVANLQYRLVSFGETSVNYIGNASIVPAGAVVVGVFANFSDNRVTTMYHRYPQVYDPVRGWVGFNNA